MSSARAANLKRSESGFSLKLAQPGMTSRLHLPYLGLFMESKSGQLSLIGQIVLLVKSNQSGSLPLLMMIFVLRVSVNADSEMQADQVGNKFKKEAH